VRKIITARDIEELLRAGEPVPPDATLTPSARDLRPARISAARPAAADPARPAPAPGPEPTVPDHEFKWRPGSDPRTPAQVEAYFRSPPIEDLKRRICDIGRRIWEKDYVDGNGGNVTVRVGDNLVLCTPTLISKGFMRPEDLCLIDLDGRQLAGTRKRTSEAMTHLAIMRRQPAAKACVHAHPPHATAFAVAGIKPPSCLIPEAEVFLGAIGYAKYETPGTPAVADTVGEVGRDHQCIIMENHGVIVWGKDVEDAYWKTENVDAYCKTIWVASQLAGGTLHQIKECELCDNSDFRPGVVCPAPQAGGPNGGPEPDPSIEALVPALAEQILKQLSARP